MGELMLEVAPAYLSDTEASDVLTPLCAAIGESLKKAVGFVHENGSRLSMSAGGTSKAPKSMFTSSGGIHRCRPAGYRAGPGHLAAPVEGAGGTLL